MNIEVNCEYKEDLVASVPVTELAAFVLSEEDCPQNAEVSISFIDDVEMACLNEEFRGKTGPTDVLSFECDGLDDEMGEGEGDIPGMPFELGDVIIAVDVAERQTEQFGTTFEGELSVLLVHGLLHLCGYDHIEDDEAEVMEAREAELLRGWARKRGLELSIFGEMNGPGALVRGEH